MAAFDFGDIVHKQERITVRNQPHDLIDAHDAAFPFIEFIIRHDRFRRRDLRADCDDSVRIACDAGIVLDRGFEFRTVRADIGEFDFDDKAVAGVVGAAELDFMKLLDVEITLAFRIKTLPETDFGELRDRFDLKHSRQNRVSGEVPHETGFVHGDGLEADEFVFALRKDPVEQEHGGTAGQDISEGGNADNFS